MGALERIEWDQVAAQVKATLSENPELYESIELVAEAQKKAGLEPVLYKKSAGFGELIIDQTQLAHRRRLGSNNIGTQIVLSRGETCPRELEYSTIPLGMVIKNAVEVFDQKSEKKEGLEHRSSKVPFHVSPLTVLHEGSFFGVFETLDFLIGSEAAKHNRWSVSAGARSIIFSHSFNDTNRVKGALRATLIKLGFSPTDIADDFPGCDHWEIVRRIQTLLAPEWAVEVLFFPGDWFFSEEIPPKIRLRFENEILKKGWQQAQPLVSSLDASKFLEKWAKNRVGNKVKGDRSLGMLGYELLSIDRGLKPCLIDARQVLGTDLEAKYKQLIPLIEVFNFILLLLAQKDGVKKYFTILLPGWLEPGIRHGYCSLFSGEIEKEPSKSIRAPFMRTLFKVFNGGLDTSVENQETEDLKLISSDSLILMQGRNRTQSKDKPAIEKQFICQQDLVGLSERSSRIDEAWYVWRYRHKLDENLLQSDETIHKILESNSKSRSKKIVKALVKEIIKCASSKPVLDCDLSWFIQFTTKVQK